MNITTKITNVSNETAADLANLLITINEHNAAVVKLKSKFVANFDHYKQFHNEIINGVKISITQPSIRLNTNKQPDVANINAQKKIKTAEIKAAHVRSINGQRPLKGDAKLLNGVTETKVNPSGSVKRV